ncbi:hypothetical protein PN466_13895 [Roseofilum reptotaenium CS-1145]|uniref:Uncharacterized protein n=1 Tax=Roseofilum reptotaenium AO1-A TaxID=1925591 RepID=A0A1L9QW21_9CYAN|nr:hypothetical protein [Roseofilum reptotaenium]MDB9518038.1 hypothetical protein [Roseofilum reptotaenium CS-1145]OJJ26878.1 hypothetical protein BI308_04075 [Roseofilum reptotaenium AO1-A]
MVGHEGERQLRHELIEKWDIKGVFAVSGQKKSALILCTDYHAEFLGPGAAITSQEQGRELVFIGLPQLVPITNRQEYHHAYSMRIQWIRWLHKLTECSPDPFCRTEKLLSSLEAFFGLETVQELNSQVLAQLIGVLPQTVTQVRNSSHLNQGKYLKDVSYWQRIQFHHALEIHTLKSPQRKNLELKIMGNG